MFTELSVNGRGEIVCLFRREDWGPGMGIQGQIKKMGGREMGRYGGKEQGERKKREMKKAGRGHYVEMGGLSRFPSLIT